MCKGKSTNWWTFRMCKGKSTNWWTFLMNRPLLNEWFHTHSLGKSRYVNCRASGYALFVSNHIVSMVSCALDSYIILNSSSLSSNMTNCSPGKWYWSFGIGGYWYCKLNSKIRRHDSIVETQRQSKYSWISFLYLSLQGCSLSSCLIPLSSIIVARSWPLCTYLYRCFTPLCTVTRSTFIWVSYFTYRSLLYGTIHWLFISRSLTTTGWRFRRRLYNAWPCSSNVVWLQNLFG